MYAFVPNTRVELRAGAHRRLRPPASSGRWWASSSPPFIVYFLADGGRLYGFAIVLTTLIWVYLSWLILLIGAQLAFYVQFPQYLRHGQDAMELDAAARANGRACP